MSTRINTGDHKKVRLFIATAWTGEPDAFREAFTLEEPLPCRVKKTPPEQLHLTWSFLGQCDAAIIPALEDIILKVTATHPPIDAMVQAPVWWPQPSRATAIACPVEPVIPLRQLAETLQNLLITLNGQTQLQAKKALNPHLTLARLKASRKQARFNLSHRHLPDLSPQPWLLDHLSLYQSTLTENGPVYRKLFSSAFHG